MCDNPYMADTDDVTRLLNRWAAGGHSDSLDEVIDQVFGELKKIAKSRLAHAPVDFTLQPTELVHEAYLRLRKNRPRGFEDRSRFYALASRLIRSILVDHARERKAVKRGGEAATVSFDELGEPALELDLDRTLTLDEALKGLERSHPRQSRVLELRLFGGLTMPQIAEATSCSQPTVERDWQLGRRRLARELRSLA